MVQPKQHELAVRYAQLNPDTNVMEARQKEARLVYGYYIKGHSLKLQADIGEVTFGKNFSTLPTLALRNVSPTLDPTKRLLLLPGNLVTDKQARIQITAQF